MPRCSVLLVVTIGVGAAVAAAAVTHAVAQQAAGLAAGMRAAMDDADNPPRSDRAKKRAPGAAAKPAETPAYGIPSGTGKTGFASQRRKPKPRGKAAAKTGFGEPPLQLFGAPEPPAAPPALPPSPDSVRKAQASATATPAGRLPVTPGGLAVPPPPITSLPPPYLLPLRKKPLVEQDAFEQVGIRAGAFLVKPAIEVSEGYDTDPARIPGGKGSWFTTVAPELNLQSQWQRHELTATIRGSYTAYDAVPSQDRPFLDARVNGRIDVSERTRFELEGRYLLSTDYPGSPNLPAGIARLPIFTDTGATFGVVHRWNRFEVALKGTVDRVEYDNAKLLDGSSVTQKGRDYDQYGALLRGSYELTPGIKPFAQVDADTRIHDLPVDAFGVQRDSHGVSGKVGTTFELSRMLTGEIAVGYLTRTYKDPNLPDLQGLLFDASLVWVATGLTTVKLAATTRADESTLFGVAGVLRRDASLQVDHAFRRWLIGTLKFNYGLDDYQGSVREDKRYSVSAALIYKLSRSWQVKGEVREEWMRSTVSGVDYAATIATLGLRWQP